MHELYSLKKIAEDLLFPAQFEFRTEELRPDVFGSYYSVYERRDEEIRFVWDGRDGWGFLEHRRQGEDNWTQIGDTILEGPLDAMKEHAIKEWEIALAKYL